MKNKIVLFLNFFKAVFSKTIFWIFFGIDGLGLFIQYIPLINKTFKNVDIPSYILWGIPLFGFFIASFQVYEGGIEEVSTNKRKLSRDTETFEELKTILPIKGSMSWLRDYDFGGAIDLNRLIILHDFNERCRHPDFEFLDHELEAMRLELFEHTDQFTMLIGEKTYPIQIPNVRLNKISHRLPDEERIRIQNDLNKLADNIYRTYSDLVKLARRKL